MQLVACEGSLTEGHNADCRRRFHGSGAKKYTKIDKATRMSYYFLLMSFKSTKS